MICIRPTLSMSVALVLSLVATSAMAQTQTPPGPPAIVTRGEAVLKRAPDRAWITIATEIREGKAADARQKSAEIMTTITAALKGTGLAPDAIRTSGFSLTPEMVWTGGKATVKDYVVRNQLEVRVDDIDKVGDVLDAANSPKSAALSIIGPRFDLKNQQAAETDALKQAVEMAVTRAQAIAAGARRSLGPILRIEEQGVGTTMPAPRPMLAQRMSLADAGGRAGGADVPETPITPGDIEIHASVILTVTIQS